MERTPRKVHSVYKNSTQNSSKKSPKKSSSTGTATSFSPNFPKNFSKTFSNVSSKFSAVGGGSGGTTRPRGRITPSGTPRRKFWILKFFLAAIAALILAGYIRLHANVISELPDTDKMQNLVLSEATIITDRNDEVLYRLFQENREYIPFDQISPHIIDGIVAMEDQRYREHDGLDAMGILRAAINNVLHPDAIQGASTIPQQLVRNVLLTRDRRIDRKLKEIILTRRLNAQLEEKVESEFPNLSSDERKRKIKENTLELYLNYIFLGNNSYGVEAASKSYFGTSAKSVDVLGASILASLPKGPSLYDPHKNRAALMGELIVRDSDGIVVDRKNNSGLQNHILTEISTLVDRARLADKSRNLERIKFVTNLLEFRTEFAGQRYSLEYRNGRKDLALGRMFDDGYITESQLKTAFLRGLNFKFTSAAINIEAPHFVHRVIDLLEEKFDKETLLNRGLTVKTSLDLEIQQKAEEIISENQTKLQQFGATNQAMIFGNSRNGDVLAYLGSADYFNEEIEGKNDMIRRRRQPGSSIKPLVYALALQNLPLTLDSPIFDIPFVIGGDRPSNADGEFMGIVPLQRALGLSRNITAIKIFQAAGGEDVVKPYLKSLGLESIQDNREYGYTLTLGAGEVSALEMAQAYAHLTADGQPADRDPILEIRATDGTLLHEKKISKRKQIIPLGVIRLIRETLSNPNNMVGALANLTNIRGLRLAGKSGTSNVETPRGNRPRDGRLALYHPSYVSIFRAGNANATPLNPNAYGATLHSDAARQFFARLADEWILQNEPVRDAETTEISINRVTGLPANANTPADLRIQSRAYAFAQFPESDTPTQPIEIDTLCGGLPGPFTPFEEIRQGYLIQAHSFMPTNMDLADIRTRFARGATSDTGRLETISNEDDDRARRAATIFNFPQIVTQAPTELCPDREPKENPEISIEILGTQGRIARDGVIAYRATAPKLLREAFVFVDGVRVGSARISPARESITDLIPITVPAEIPDGPIELKVSAVDIEGFSNSITRDRELTSIDSTPPSLQNQRRTDRDDGSTEIRLFITDDLSLVSDGQVLRGDSIVHRFEGSITTFTTDDPTGLTLVVEDTAGNELRQPLQR